MAFRLVILVAAALLLLPSGAAGCFGRIFCFGDSLSDTGNFLLSVPDDYPDPARSLPYGQTFFRRPSGRYSDGRNLLDFLAQAFGLPFVAPYLGGRGDHDFRNGANFAVGGATALNASFFRELGVEPTWTQHSLDEQLRWFEQLLPVIAASESDFNNIMSSSLFLVGEIGGNDYNHLIVRGRSLEEIRAVVPSVINAISSAISRLIKLGAKKLVVPGNFPIGCVPLYLSIFPSQEEEYYDPQTGCVKWLNEFVEYYNHMLQEELQKLRDLHPHTTIIYADYYGATMNIFRAPLQFGFTVPLNACCGSDAPYNCSPSIMCGHPGSTVCPDPSKYISWDGLHLTEATYKVAIEGVLGPYAVPPFSEACPDGEYKVSQLLHSDQCMDSPTNDVSDDPTSSVLRYTDNLIHVKV